MDRNEFERQLAELRREISHAAFSYHVWLALWPTPEDVLNRYRGFFIPVRDALYGAWVMGLARVFDSDSRTMSLRNLLREARNDPTKLVPRLTSSETEQLEQRLLLHDTVCKAIKQLRDQHIAHLDAMPLKELPLVKKDVEAMLQTLGHVFGELSKAHNAQDYSWSHQTKRSVWQTTEILRILDEDAAAQKAKADALMKAVEEDGA